jgi:hypothetical protein
MKVIVAMKKKKIKEMNMVKLMAIIIMMKMVIIKCINIIVMMVLNMKVKMMVLNIICISVIVRLVSITPVMLNLIDYPRLKLIELMIILLIINIKYIEIIHLITLLIINTNHYENKQTIVVSCYHTDDSSYHTSIESRAN